MLPKFLSTNREELIERCRDKVAKRAPPEATGDELDHGIPFFLHQLIKTLRVEQTATPSDSLSVSGPAGGEKEEHSEMGAWRRNMAGN